MLVVLIACCMLTAYKRRVKQARWRYIGLCPIPREPASFYDTRCETAAPNLSPSWNVTPDALNETRQFFPQQVRLTLPSVKLVQPNCLICLECFIILSVSINTIWYCRALHLMWKLVNLSRMWPYSG